MTNPFDQFDDVSGAAAMAIPIAGEAARMGATTMTRAAAQRALDVALPGGNLPRLPGGIFQLPRIGSQTPLPGILNAIPVLASARGNGQPVQ